MSLQTTAAAILTGGRARRFGGRDKSRLIVDGRSIIVRQVETLQLVTREVFLVGHSPERFADLNLPVFPDRVQGLGALGGILTALESTRADHVLVIACDMPFLAEGLLRALVAHAADADAAWVHTQRGPEPLVACYRRTALAPIKAAVMAGDLKVADLGQRLRIHALSGRDLAAFGAAEQLLTNLNTPEDYARVQ
ncbi:MAG: molybdenum cofactor guanylyltransferase [Acidobacteria bacterium]|nr:molybdenum cofactor guanylyltransferase [Acidobacteriota bacterium]